MLNYPLVVSYAVTLTGPVVLTTRDQCLEGRDDAKNRKSLATKFADKGILQRHLFVIPLDGFEIQPGGVTAKQSGM